ncbi:MAG: DUF1080 domain-containing protein [Phycisphaera sp.]|nr:DUF1080 domain-containing protein [Phycisphaera sp.]
MTPTKTATIAALALLTLISAAFAAEGTKPEDKPGYDKSHDLGAKAPDGADMLFDGTQESIDKNWVMWSKDHEARDDKITWSLVKSPTDDTMVLMTNGGNTWGTHDLVTKKKYQDFEGHAEFVLMGKRGDDSPEGYANSGVYLQNRYEIQIESPKGKDAADPYNWKIGPHGIGAFCMDRVPDVNAWRPNGQWQSFHFIFKAAKWEGDKIVEPARATVWWNGIKVHDNAAISKINGGIPAGPNPGGLKLQEHGNDVRFRNVWVKEVK